MSLKGRPTNPDEVSALVRAEPPLGRANCGAAEGAAAAASMSPPPEALAIEAIGTVLLVTALAAAAEAAAAGATPAPAPIPKLEVAWLASLGGTIQGGAVPSSDTKLPRRQPLFKSTPLRSFLCARFVCATRSRNRFSSSAISFFFASSSSGVCRSMSCWRRRKTCCSGRGKGVGVGVRRVSVVGRMKETEYKTHILPCRCSSGRRISC